MFFSFRFVVFIFFSVLLNPTESKTNFPIKCEYSSEGRDQSLSKDDLTRRKRFVLFPEFKLWFNDWRYLNHPKNFLYWISNYYPQKIDSKFIQLYIHQIINDINQIIDYKISSIQQALSADQSNFNYNFFNYEICPRDDHLATMKDVENIETMLIYPVDIIKKNRYRAHGGIILNHENNSTRSHMKFNLHHQFLIYQDFQYDPVIYTCNSDESYCMMDLYSTMLHESFHGFGIEHTERNLPNKKMVAVMHLYASRIMCHDDIRAIRMVYGFAVKRENSKYDDTCRRDFPMNRIQKLMYRIQRWLNFYIFQIGSSISFIVFLLTMIYILLKGRYINRNDDDDDSVTSSTISDDFRQQYKKQYKSAKNAFLWHDDYLNG